MPHGRKRKKVETGKTTLPQSQDNDSVEMVTPFLILVVVLVVVVVVVVVRIRMYLG